MINTDAPVVTGHKFYRTPGDTFAADFPDGIHTIAGVPTLVTHNVLGSSTLEITFATMADALAFAAAAAAAE